MWGGIPSQSCGKTHGHTPSVNVNTRVLSCKSPRQDAKSAEEECPSGPLGKHRPRPAQVGSRFDALRGPKTQRNIHTVTCKSPRQKEGRSPKPPQAPKRPEEHGRQSHSSSSLASGALQDTWRLLDLGSSPSGLTSQGDSTPGEQVGMPPPWMGEEPAVTHEEMGDSEEQSMPPL
ncbi:coiled-coil domain-containing protein 57-like isoform X2 [Macaca nemestrina]|uniref:coiled-coil domain-containing protein 57-like isoform X2 n=1 Tax=Macaca nemestrina TaxID=9545 RepID=UPI0039B9427E